MSDFLLSNGPNLKFPGSHEPDIYAADSLADVEKPCIEVENKPGYSLVRFIKVMPNTTASIVGRSPRLTEPTPI